MPTKGYAIFNIQVALGDVESWDEAFKKASEIHPALRAAVHKAVPSCSVILDMVVVQPPPKAAAPKSEIKRSDASKD